MGHELDTQTDNVTLIEVMEQPQAGPVLFGTEVAPNDDILQDEPTIYSYTDKSGETHISHDPGDIAKKCGHAAMILAMGVRPETAFAAFVVKDENVKQEYWSSKNFSKDVPSENNAQPVKKEVAPAKNIKNDNTVEVQPVREESVSEGGVVDTYDVSDEQVLEYLDSPAPDVVMSQSDTSEEQIDVVTEPIANVKHDTDKKQHEVAPIVTALETESEPKNSVDITPQPTTDVLKVVDNNEHVAQKVERLESTDSGYPSVEVTVVSDEKPSIDHTIAVEPTELVGDELDDFIEITGDEEEHSPAVDLLEQLAPEGESDTIDVSLYAEEVESIQQLLFDEVETEDSTQEHISLQELPIEFLLLSPEQTTESFEEFLLEYNATENPEDALGNNVESEPQYAELLTILAEAIVSVKEREDTAIFEQLEESVKISEEIMTLIEEAVANAEHESNAVILTPQITKKLLELIDSMGVEDGKEMLVDLIAKGELGLFLSAVQYLSQLRVEEYRPEFESSVTAHSVFSNISTLLGQVVMRAHAVHAA